MARQSQPYGYTIPGDPANGASLETLMGIFVAAEFGRPERQCDLFDAYYDRDLTLQSLVDGRVAALGKPTAILAASDAPQDQAAAAMWGEIWRNLPVDRLIAWLQHGSLAYGWAGVEIDWAVSPRGEIVPRGFFWTRSRMFRFATEAYSPVSGAEPEELLVRVGKNPDDVARLAPDKWIVARRAPHIRLARSGLMHSCARYALLRGQNWAHWFSFLRRYGLPTFKVELHSQADAAQRALAEQILERLGEDVGFVTDKDAAMEISTVDGMAASRSSASDPQERFSDSVASEYARLWTGIPSENSGVGSYHLGRALSGIREDLLMADARRIEAAINNGLIEPWHRLNGLAGRPPRVAIRLAEKISDPAVAVDIAGKLQPLGLTVDPAQLAELTGLRIVPASDPPDGSEGNN